LSTPEVLPASALAVLLGPVVSVVLVVPVPVVAVLPVSVAAVPVLLPLEVSAVDCPEVPMLDVSELTPVWLELAPGILLPVAPVTD